LIQGAKENGCGWNWLSLCHLQSEGPTNRQ
jgi:hypothetical protein